MPTPNFEQLLAEDFSPLGDDRAAALDYVLRAGDARVLERVGGRLKVKVAGGFLGPDRQALLSALLAGDSDLLRRLGQVWAAAGDGRGCIAELEQDRWLECVVWEASSLSPNTSTRAESALAAEALEPDCLRRLAHLALSPARQPDGSLQYVVRNFGEAILAIRGFGRVLEREAEFVSRLLREGDAEARVFVCERLEAARTKPEPFLPALVELAVSDSKRARAAALRHLGQAGDPPARRALWAVAEDAGRPGAERGHAVEALFSLGGADAARFEALLAAAKGPLKKALEHALEALSPAVAAAPTPPPRVDLPPVPAELRQALRSLADEWYAAAPGIVARYQSQFPKFQAPALQPIGDEVIEQAVRLVAQPEPWPSARRLLAALERHPTALPPDRIVEALAAARLPPVYFVRAWQLFCERHDLSTLMFVARQLRLQPAQPPVDLLQLDAAARLAGFGPMEIGSLVLRRWLREWGKAQVAYLAAHPELAEAALGQRTLPGLDIPPYQQREARVTALQLVSEMDAPPPTLVPALWDVALKGLKIERPLAQKALSRLPGHEPRILEALKDKSQDARAGAAHWLASKKLASALPALRAALAQEKREPVRLALLEALEALGEPLDSLMDRRGLLERAQRILAESRCPVLAWPEAVSLPALHWADNGAGIDPAIVLAWIAEAHKTRNPAPSPLLRLYARAVRPEDGRALARTVLLAWIARDVAQEPSFDEHTGFSRGSSAIEDKGVLAVAGAFGGPGLAEIVGRYLKDWYGLRAAQCRALLNMLAWVEDRAAIQLLLATGTRFRTASIRAEAEKLTRELAERKGWTVDELGDRTIPDAGLDETGRILIDYGERRFTARLDYQLRLSLADAEDGAIKSLPEARKGEDEEKVKQARAAYSRSRKQIETVVKQQRERLYEAMCTQRTWRFADWETFLAAHPVARNLVVGVVWTAEHDGRHVSFRPLGDGSLSAAGHEEVKLSPDAAVRVAHELTLPEGQVQEWTAHLGDFEVMPLFRQFGRPAFRLPDERRGELELADFQGHLIEAFKLRGKALGLGYIRGPAEDGGWFYRYDKALPSLGLRVELAFSGNGLPEENRTVALQVARFVPTTPGEPARPLGEVPQVLLSEVRADLKELSAAGTGFDPDWESKIGL
ncbi:MAG TPA: DUF4132 domain-containing protein [Myxococcales bacterium]